MTIQDIPQHAELERLYPEAEDWDDYDAAAFCGSCGFAWDACACDRHVTRMDEREGGSRAEARLEHEMRNHA